MKVHLFIPCFIDQLSPQIGFSTIKILEKLGCEVVYNPEQTCCGQPAYNAGYFEEARDVSQKFLDDFSHAEYVVMPSASCTGMVRNSFTQLFGDTFNTVQRMRVQKNVYELTEFLTDVLQVDRVEGASFPCIAVYHDACSALRECGIQQGPRKLLAGVQGLQLRELKASDVCCGFGGTFAVKFEPISVGMAQQKIEDAMAQSAEYIISGDYSCLLHLDGYIQKQGLPLKTIHIADVLASGL